MPVCASTADGAAIQCSRRDDFEDLILFVAWAVEIRMPGSNDISGEAPLGRALAEVESHVLHDCRTGLKRIPRDPQCRCRRGTAETRWNPIGCRYVGQHESEIW